MNLWSRITGRETRSETVRSSDPYIAEFFGQRGGLGSAVDVGRASGLATAHVCLGVISQSLASVPLNVYRRTANGGREKATDYPLYSVLHDQSNAQMTAFEAREFFVVSLLTRGNAFARIVSNGRGQVSGLIPLDVDTVAVERLESGRLRYRVSDPKGGTRVYLQEEMLHLRYRLGRDGIMGLSPIQLARETFNLAMTQQNTAHKQARNAFRPEGALSFPNEIGMEAHDHIVSRLEKKIESQSSTNGVLVLDGGVDWKSFSFSARDAEFLENRKLTALDICRVFGVPPSVAGITDNATYSNIGEESRALVMRCLAPMARRIEQAMTAALIGTEARKTLLIEHDLAGLLRGDLKARYEAYRIGREWGWLSANEIRGWENLSGIDGGDEYLVALNMRGSQDGGDDGA